MSFEKRSFADDRSARSTPTGPGSRGGRWHEPEYRAQYHRAWRRGNPEYRERERLRRARARAAARGEDPALVVVPPSYPRELPLTIVGAFCTCHCDCDQEVVLTCGFCREGLHEGRR